MKRKRSIAWRRLVLAAAVLGVLLGFRRVAWVEAAIGVICLTGVFLAAIAGLRGVLGRGGRVLSVARTVVDEALRMKVALILIVMLLVAIPVLPLTLEPTDPLRYRIQTFLTYSTITAGFLLSAMTIFLACGTLSWEVENKQVFNVAVKPIGRVSYLLGKWIGIVLLDGVLLGVVALAIYGFTVGYLAKLPAKNAPDELAVKNEVLVARVTEKPEAPGGLDEAVDKSYEQMLKQSPELIDKAGGEVAMRNELRHRILSGWMSLGPLRQQTYIFTGLDRAKDYTDTVQLRYKVNVSKSVPNDQIVLGMAVNGQPAPLQSATGVAQVVPINVNYINSKGELQITLANPNPYNPTVTFAENSLEVLYTVGGFGGNFLRSVLAIWVRLGFLAMLGLAAATFLSFPVACMATIWVFLIAIGSGFLLEAAGSFAAPRGEKGVEAVSLLFTAIRGLAWSVASLLHKYSEFSPTDRLADGRLFSWGQVLGAIGWVGIVWTGLVGAAGALIYRNRELARVQV